MNREEALTIVHRARDIYEQSLRSVESRCRGSAFLPDIAREAWRVDPKTTPLMGWTSRPEGAKEPEPAPDALPIAEGDAAVAEAPPVTSVETGVLDNPSPGVVEEAKPQENA